MDGNKNQYIITTAFHREYWKTETVNKAKSIINQLFI